MDTVNTPEDLFTRYKLPALDRAPVGSEAAGMVGSAKVLRYATTMPVSFREILDPEKYVDDLRTHMLKKPAREPGDAQEVVFEGVTGRELNRLLEQLPVDKKVRVRVASRTVQLDESVRLRSGTIICGEGAELDAGSIDIAAVGHGLEDAGLEDFTITAPRACGVMLLGCRSIGLHGLTVRRSGGCGMVLRKGTSCVWIDGCTFLDNTRSGLTIEDGSHHVCVTDCEVTGGRHSSNWSAGIVISAIKPVSDYGIVDAFEPSHFYPRDLEFKSDAVPHHNLIKNCRVHHNQSSGIYVDGGNGNAVIENRLFDNDKEGICLDFYAAANVVISNMIERNGFRRRQSDRDLEIDCILGFGRLSDGSAVAKLPNISMDNSGLNLVLMNSIAGAAGDGIKIVRAGFRNLLGLNSITDNNRGHNDTFCFAGILLGSAGCEVENDSSGLDRLPALENIIFENTISGSHASGIVYDAKSTYNDTLRNTVAGQKGPPVVLNAEPNAMVGNSFAPGQGDGAAVRAVWGKLAGWCRRHLFRRTR